MTSFQLRKTFQPHKLIWGAGPVSVLPTATNEILGQEKLSVGPSIVTLVQSSHWTIGTLTNNVWSVAGSGDRTSVNQMTLQYFINYNLKNGHQSLAPIERPPRGNVWTAPVGGIGRVMRLGMQPVNISSQFYENAKRPSAGARWGMRVQIAFLFPKRPNE